MSIITLQNGLDNRPVFHIPGAYRILLIPQADIYRCAINSENRVEEVYLVSGKKWNLFNDMDNISFTKTPKLTKNGTLYQVEIGFTVNVQTTSKNNLFNSLRETELTAVVQDKNNRWWMVGNEQPLKVSSQEEIIDNDNNVYKIKLFAEQRKQVLGMSQAWFSTLDMIPMNDAVDTIDGANVPIAVITPQTNGTVIPTPVIITQITITTPPTGYVITPAVGVVFAAANTTIKLPPSAVNGQEHTIKDFSGNSSYSLPITVDGNGHSIDGEATVSINTDYGALKVIYVDGVWLTTGFVN